FAAARTGPVPETGGQELMRSGDRMVKDSFSLAVAIGLTTGTRFFYHMLVSRKLGTADYGTLVTLLGILVLMTLPVNALQLALAHHVTAATASDGPGAARRLFRATQPGFLWIGIGMSLGVWAISGPLGNFLKIDDGILLLLLATMAVWNLLLGQIRGVLQGVQRFIAVGTVLLFDGLLKIAAAALLMIVLLPLRGAWAANVVSAAIAWIIGLALIRRALPRADPAPSQPARPLGPLFRYALPVFLSLLGFSVLGYLDVFMAKHLFEEHEAGLYAAAAIVGKTFLFIPDAIALTLFSKASEKYAKSRNSRALLLKALILTGALLTPSLLVCALLPETIVHILFGVDFLDAAPLVRWFGFAMIPFVFLSVVVHYSLAQHRYRILATLFGGSVLYGFLLLRFGASPRAVMQTLFWTSLGILVASLAAAKGWKGSPSRTKNR
ncbi:MAG: oligosaccharide flippase family protein, partial [Kiritimatiellia bacterium]|nr:oligosaccharide flippase family protein [Kiritimatiellia bacterium]